MNTPDIHVATTEDAGAVVALWQSCALTRPWNDPGEDFYRAVVGSASDVLVVRDQAMIVGSVMVGEDGHRGWVYYLAVCPTQRRTGLGRALMDAAERWMRLRGVPKLQLMVRDGNDETQAFYRALGLEQQAVVTMGKFLKG